MDVADQLKISQSAYCRIELGHTKIVVNTLLDIAEILNVKASALINIVNESTCLVKTDLTISIHHISNFV